MSVISKFYNYLDNIYIYVMTDTLTIDNYIAIKNILESMLDEYNNITYMLDWRVHSFLMEHINNKIKLEVI